MAGLILGVVGGVNRAPNSSTGGIDPSNYNSGATYLKVSAFLFLFAILAVGWGLVSFWSQRSALRKSVQYAVVAAAISLPLLSIRLIYSFLSSFNLDTSTSEGHSKSFNTLTGSWVAYFLLVCIPQILVVGAYNVAGFLGRDGKDFKRVDNMEIQRIPNAQEAFR